MKESEILSVNCPTCRKQVIWNEDSPYRPFCSKRCQLIDLGDWASEKHSIPCNNMASDAENWSKDDLSKQGNN